ncbi:MAG: ACP S-malonyltransferase [Rhodospirillales bacterium]|nr:ACP S-malonyltransferase [Rhodospirillales bacterium]
MTRALIFPGQGSQAVGMGKDLAAAFPEARFVFEEVDDALEQKLSKIMFEGPEDALTLTENAQPALMAMSVALLRVLEKQAGFKVATGSTFVAGHSLGEYSALTAAGTFVLGDAARVLKMRGQSMQQAVPVGQGAMAALIGVDLEVAEEIAAEAAGEGVCTAANDNAPGQIVLSGSASAIDRAVEIAKEKGAKRSIVLPVSAPFHCALMAPAADVMSEVLADLTLQPPVVPVVANVTAAPEENPAEIRRLLVEQVTSRVRWRECILKLKELGVDTFVEVGTGKVLTGMIRRIDKELAGMSVQSADDIDAFLSSL